MQITMLKFKLVFGNGECQCNLISWVKRRKKLCNEKNYIKIDFKKFTFSLLSSLYAYTHNNYNKLRRKNGEAIKQQKQVIIELIDE